MAPVVWVAIFIFGASIAIVAYAYFTAEDDPYEDRSEFEVIGRRIPPMGPEARSAYLEGPHARPFPLIGPYDWEREGDFDSEVHAA